MIGNIQEACEAYQEKSDLSPLYLTIALGLQDLRAAGCLPAGNCHLMVQTDGQETVSAPVKNAIRNGSASTADKQKPVSLPAPLDNQGIAITFCGYAHSLRTLSGNSSVENLASTEATWKQMLTVPSLFTLQPECP